MVTQIIAYLSSSKNHRTIFPKSIQLIPTCGEKFPIYFGDEKGPELSLEDSRWTAVLFNSVSSAIL